MRETSIHKEPAMSSMKSALLERIVYKYNNSLSNLFSHKYEKYIKMHDDYYFTNICLF